MVDSEAVVLQIKREETGDIGGVLNDEDAR